MKGANSSFACIHDLDRDGITDETDDLPLLRGNLDSFSFKEILISANAISILIIFIDILIKRRSSKYDSED